MQIPEFLETEDVLNIHNVLVEQFGGMPGVRDKGLLESTAYGGMEAFLRLNGYNLNLTDDEAYDMVMRVAQGEMTKEEHSRIHRTTHLGRLIC